MRLFKKKPALEVSTPGVVVMNATIRLPGRPVVLKVAIATDGTLWSNPEANGKVRQHQIIGLSYIAPIGDQSAQGLQLCVLWLLVCIGW